MIRTLTFALALTSLPCLAVAQDAPPAQQARIAAALTEDVVEIRSDFAGAPLTIFGAAEGLQDGDDIVVAVRGPERDLRVMKKERVLGIWVNSAPVRFESVASYYAVASTRPLSDFAGFAALRRNGIGMTHLPLRAPDEERTETLLGVPDVVVSDLGAEIVDYRQAIVRNKTRQSLYVEADSGVERLEGGLFIARLFLPSETPVGDYTIEVYLFRDGAPIASRETQLQVAKAGMERVLYDLAHDRPILYGLLALIMAALSGWLAAVVTRNR
ncbi:TIGR02186 family protein [Maricaulaceae bacterium EIL42A08]|nr:TIGR02186 family protein [Maricaulaceae bacterium EIL42A08]